MRFIVLGTSSTSSDYNADFDYAVVIADAQFVDNCLARIDKARAFKAADSDFRELSWWDWSPEFLGYCDIDLTDEERTAVDDNGFIIVNKPPDFIKDKGQRRDASWVIADEDSVHWRCIPKHTDIYICTRGLRLEDLDELKKGET